MKKYYNFISLFMIISLYLIAFTLYVVAGEYKEIIGVIASVTTVIAMIYGIWKRKEIITLIKTSLFKNISSNLLTVSLIFLILCMVNYLFSKNDKLFDFTAAKIHSLSEQSKNILSNLKESELKLTLFSKREDWGRYLNLLRLYEKENSNVVLKAVDVDRDVALVRLNNIEHNGTLLIEYQGKSYRSVIKDELGVTNLLMRVLRPNKLILYNVIGHNQLDLDLEDPIGASALKGMILGSNYEIRNIDLSEKIPADAAGVIILNPQTSFLQRELDELYHYLIKGGALLLSMSPQFNEIRLSGLDETLKKFGVRFENGLILDRLAEGQGGQASIPIVSNYPKDHPITKKFEGRTVFPVSGFFTILNEKVMDWNVLASSTPFPASWGEMSFSEVKSGKAVYAEKKDFKGPLNMALAGENKDTRIVLFSSSSFITNQFQGQSNNFNLFLNALSWMVDDEALLSLERPELEGNLIYISDVHLSMVFYFVILCFPFLFFGIAIFSYRYKLGR